MLLLVVVIVDSSPSPGNKSSSCTVSNSLSNSSFEAVFDTLDRTVPEVSSGVTVMLAGTFSAGATEVLPTLFFFWGRGGG
jgi:hypothetical protein